jgi:hypothetical protein
MLLSHPMKGQPFECRKPSNPMSAATAMAMVLAVSPSMVFAQLSPSPPAVARPALPNPTAHAPVLVSPPRVDAPGEEPAFRRGVLLMPFLGAHLALGDTSKYFNLGYRVGGMAGWHASRSLSLNGELAFDRYYPIDLENGSQVKASASDLAFSPLFHLALDRGVIVIGPKIGAYRFISSQGDWTTPAKDGSRYGLVYGLTLGAFGGIGDRALGVLLGYNRRHVTGACATGQGWAKPCSNGASDLTSLFVAVAALF